MARATWMSARVALSLSLIAAVACGGDVQPSAERVVRHDKKPVTAAPTKRAAPADKAAPVAPRPVVRAPAAPAAPAAVVPTKPEIAIPDDYRGAMRAGKELREQGDLSRALAAFDKAAAKAPRRAAPHVDAARVHLTSGDIEGARERAERSIELDSESSSAWNTMGRVELAEGSLEAAAVSFERAGEINPDNSYAWNNLGFVRLEQKDYEAAVVALERATSGVVVTGYMWNNLGMAYEHLDRLDEARASYGQGADAGSALALDNGTRLEGVDSIAVSKGVADAYGDLAAPADDELLETVGIDASIDSPVVGDVASNPVPVRE